MEIIQADLKVRHQADLRVHQVGKDKVMPEAGQVLQEINQVEAGATTPLLRTVKVPC